jgi:hypothetical protein
LHETPGGTENDEPATNTPADAGIGLKRKKCGGGPRKSLIRLDSAKEIQGFSLAKFGRALLDEAWI